MLLIYLNLSVLIILEIVFRLCIGEISSFSFLIFPSGSMNERKLFSLLKILTVAVLAHFPSVVSSHSELISKGFVSERYILRGIHTERYLHSFMKHSQCMEKRNPIERLIWRIDTVYDLKIPTNRPVVDNFNHPRGSSSRFSNLSWSAMYQHFYQFQN